MLTYVIQLGRDACILLEVVLPRLPLLVVQIVQLSQRELLYMLRVISDQHHVVVQFRHDGFPTLADHDRTARSRFGTARLIDLVRLSDNRLDRRTIVAI